MIILFDGFCNLCDRFVDFVIKRDKTGIFQFAPLQGGKGQSLLQERGLEAQKLRTIVLITETKTFLKSDAAIRIISELPGWSWLSILRVIPRPVRDIGYSVIAACRYAVLGKRDSCRTPSAIERARFLE